jgi:4-coumarate--CoA ligase
MRLSEAKIIITDAKRLPSVLNAANDVGLPSTAIYLFDHGKDPIAQQPNMTFADLTKHGELDWHDIYRDDASNRLGSSSRTYTLIFNQNPRTAVLNFSSGTTGMPKGCMVSHRNLVANCVQVMVADDAANARNGKVDNAGEVHCAYVPLYHASKSKLSLFKLSHIEAYLIPFSDHL